MIEYQRLVIRDTPGIGHVRIENISPEGLRGGPIMLWSCKSCGVLVVDTDLHSKHHQTPVVG